MMRENFDSGMSVEAGFAKLDTLEPEVRQSPFRSTPSLFKEFAGQEHGQTSWKRFHAIRILPAVVKQVCFILRPVESRHQIY